MDKVLVTGAAGFIGFHLANKLLENSYKVVGIDNLNDYYDPNLKKDRVKLLEDFQNFAFKKIDIVSQKDLTNLFNKEKFDYVVNLAAQAGVRYSIDHPEEYIQNNIVGFFNVLESCRKYPVKHLVYASSSSVYGANVELPFREDDNVDHPVSMYAATKKSNELMSHAYANLYNIPSTGLRFFTVYGPWGRPDMALFLFTKAIIDEQPIRVFNNGEMVRDFTYVDDIVDGIVKTLAVPPELNKELQGSNLPPSKSFAPYRIMNIGNNKPENLLEFISILENAIGKKAIVDLQPMQPGDVRATYADLSNINSIAEFSPRTSIREGIPKFVEWYRSYYKL